MSRESILKIQETEEAAEKMIAEARERAKAMIAAEEAQGKELCATTEAETSASLDAMLSQIRERTVGMS